MSPQNKTPVKSHWAVYLVILNLLAIAFVVGKICTFPGSSMCYGPSAEDPGPACASGSFVATSAIFDREFFRDGRGIFTVDSGDSRLALISSYADSGLQIIDLSNPRMPVALKSIRDGALDSGGRIFKSLGGAQSVLAVKTETGMYALVGSDGDKGVQIIDISSPDKPRALSVINSDTHPGSDKPAGYASIVQTARFGGKTYALISAYNKYSPLIHIYDISRPSRPAFVASFSKLEDRACYGEKRCVKDGISDIATVTIGGKTYALATSFSDDGVQVIDISAPDQPREAAAVFDGQSDGYGGRYTALWGAVAIDTFWLRQKAYALVASRGSHAVQIIDISRPQQPLAAGVAFLDHQPKLHKNAAVPGGLTDIAVTVKGDKAYALASAWGDQALYILDVSQPAEPVVLASFADGAEDAAGNTIPALAGASAVSIFTDESAVYAAVTSSLDGGVQILDISNPGRAVAAAFLTEGGGSSNSVTALDGPADVQMASVAGRPYALVASYMGNGIQIIDISNPEEPRAVASITDGEKDGSGSEFTALRGARDLAVTIVGDRTYALAASYFAGGIQIIDISDPAWPQAVAAITDEQKDGSGLSYATLKGAQDVVTARIDGRTYAVVASHLDDGVQIIDISVPREPRAVASVTDGSLDSSGAIFSTLAGAAETAVAVIGGRTYAFVASSLDDGMQIIDISEPAQPKAVSAVTDRQESAGSAVTMLAGASAVSIATANDKTYALVASYLDEGVQIIDVSEPARPRTVPIVADKQSGAGGVLTVSGGATDITTATVDGRIYAFVSSYPGDAVQVIDITDPENPAPAVTICEGGKDRNGQPFTALKGPTAIASADLNGVLHILVTSETDDGVQIASFGYP